MVDDEASSTEQKEPQQKQHDQHNLAASSSESRKSEEEAVVEQNSAGTGLHRRLWVDIRSHKRISIPVAVILVMAILLAIPFSRYALAALLIRKDFSVVIIDSQTNKPVSSATLTLAGKTATTDNAGTAKINTKVGTAKLMVFKKYYHTADQSVFVPIGKQKQPLQVRLVATGRQVPIVVTNKISGKPVANATISAQGTEAKTDKKGEVTIVLPADKTTISAQVSSSGYNATTVEIKVTAGVDPANTFQITPAGKIYFLSNLSGNLDVVKTNLDGTDRYTVLAGTGKEDKPSTVLLASRDWKYVALLSKRDGGDNAKLFLIDTSNDQLITMDEGDATFSPLGWSGDRFVYSLSRTKVDPWQPKRGALKSYDASSKKLTLLDETNATGDQSNFVAENIIDTYIFNQEIVYLKTWNGVSGLLNGKQATINSIQSDGSQQKVVKAYDLSSTAYFDIQSRPADLNEIYIRTQSGVDAAQHDEYKDGKVIAANDITDDQYRNNTYPTYIVSPSGSKTFWTDYRDGKNVFFVGDGQGTNGKQLVGSSADYAAYGWYSDDYVLVTVKGSEMRIMPASGLLGGVDAAQKISDYYKPNYNLRGYGYGYGG